MQLNAEAVKSRADIVQVLGHYGQVRLRQGGKARELVGECPLPGHAKSGKAPGGAFTVTPATQLFYCFKCGVGGDVFDLIKLIEGYSRFDQVIQHVAELMGMASDPVLAAGSGRVEPLCKISGENLPEPTSAPAVQGKVVATYPYVDERGELLYEVQRIEPGRNGKAKDFRQRQPDPNRPGVGWIPNMDGARRVLYHLPAVLTASEVYIVEGEKDAECLSAEGLLATTNSGGASAPWLDEYSEALRGKRVVILPDQDEPGRKHGATVEAALKDIASDVITVNVPEGKDVTEYLESGKTVENLLALVAKTREQKLRDELRARGLLSPDEVYESHPGGINAFLQPKHGLKTGFRVFDEMTLGLHPGEVTILAARPSVGKTALALNIATNIAKAGRGVAIFSYEMSSVSLHQRLLCSLARVNQSTFRAGYLNEAERHRIHEALGMIREWPIFMDDEASSNLDQIRHKLKLLMDRHGAEIAVVDYLQLMCGDSRENRNQEVSGLSRGLKLMARELNIPFLVLSQLSRASEKRPGGHEPQLSDLRDSGSIEQDADVVAFIHRPDVFKARDEPRDGRAYLLVAKQRNGPTGSVNLIFRGEFTQFENYSGMEVVA